MYQRICIFFIVCFSSLFAEPTFQRDKTICLNMIVKDEAPVMRRCLESLKDLIDYWVIVDTGSTDGTQEIILDCLKDIPGELLERPWENFAANRNQALEASQGKADYILLIDADEWLVFEPEFSVPELEKDFYAIVDVCDNVQAKVIFLINNHLFWYWEGAIHEDILSGEATTRDLLKHVKKLEKSNEGNRSLDPLKYQKDVLLIEQELKKNPSSPRYLFYLGETCYQIQDLQKALEAFERRAQLGGWPEEVFWSMYRTAQLKERLGYEFSEVCQAYQLAFRNRPIRAEPLYHLGLFYLSNNEGHRAYLTLKRALSIPVPNDTVFVDVTIYEYKILLAFIDASFKAGKYDETKGAILKALQMPSLDERIKDNLEINLKILEEEYFIF